MREHRVDGFGQEIVLDVRPFDIELRPEDARLFARLFPVDVGERKKLADYQRELDHFRRQTRR